MITIPEVDFWIMVVSLFVWGMGFKSMLDQLWDMWHAPDDDEDDYYLDEDEYPEEGQIY